jgi:hypothetical protein
VAVISELAPYGMAEHMVGHWEAKLGGFPGACDALPEGGIGPRTFPRGDEHIRRGRILACQLAQCAELQPVEGMSAEDPVLG